MSNRGSANPMPGTAPVVLVCPVNGARAKHVDILTDVYNRLPRFRD